MKIEKLFGDVKDNLWGGDRLIKFYNKAANGEICAESWELSFHSDGPTKLSDGKTLMESASDKDLGKNTLEFADFPMMIKLIDAKENLSVQVHPDDTYAKANENSYGKTEMWYIVDADEGAGIYLGFKRELEKEEVISAIKSNTLTEIMNFFPVSKGDCYFIPSGTIHAIGAGCLIYEIQQSSNITYRVYDYDRRDKYGNTRELHIDKAMDVLKFERYERRVMPSNLLGISKYFTAHKMELNGESESIKTDGKSFMCVTVCSGNGTLNAEPVSAGDSYFIPATENEITLGGNMTLIIASLRKYGVGYEECGGRIYAYIYNDLGERVLKAEGADKDEALKNVMVAANITENDITI
ncbi:MAG: class I mannose-6-phosphate isomerase [Clostridia bacterium]|nr:class I mannose-6-phosphate isomerase [Clostridia bacterium]